MTAMLFLIPMALVLIAVAIGLFVWSLKRGQFEDMQGPAHRIIFEDREEQTRRHGHEESPRDSDRSANPPDGKS